MAVGAAGLAAFKNAEMGEDEEMEGVDEGEGSDEGESEDELEVVDEEGFSDFVDAVYDAASDIESAAMDVGEDLNHDDQPSEGAVAKMKEQISAMPAPIQDGIEDYLKGMEWEQVHGLAEGMEEAGLIDDADQVCGWLYWAAKNAEGTAEHEEEESEEEEYEEHDDEDEYEDDDMIDGQV